MTSSTSPNLATVQTLYQAFAARDRARILELFDPEIEWIQNDGFPNGGRHVGATLVLDEVLARLRSEWDGWQVRVDRWLDAGEAIVALGAYHGTHKETGKSMRAAFAHVYWVKEARIVRFEQYTDTLQLAEAMRP
jgi:ketosteroid isomerase-like protein